MIKDTRTYVFTFHLIIGFELLGIILRRSDKQQNRDDTKTFNKIGFKNDVPQN